MVKAYCHRASGREVGLSISNCVVASRSTGGGRLRGFASSQPSIDPMDGDIGFLSGSSVLSAVALTFAERIGHVPRSPVPLLGTIANESRESGAPTTDHDHRQLAHSCPGFVRTDEHPLLTAGSRIHVTAPRARRVTAPRFVSDCVTRLLGRRHRGHLVNHFAAAERAFDCRG